MNIWVGTQQQGGLKEDACEKLLQKLEAHGMLKLPEKRRCRGGVRPKITSTENTAPDSQISCSLKDIGPVWLEVVEGRQKSLWNEYVQRYHPLGYKQPFGYHAVLHSLRKRQIGMPAVLRSGEGAWRAGPLDRLD